MVIKCSVCGQGLESSHAKCIETPISPRIIWEGKCWASGQECECRAVLVHEADKHVVCKVVFEYARDKDKMGAFIWLHLGSTPDQFVGDAARMMDTARNPNRTGTPKS